MLAAERVVEKAQETIDLDEAVKLQEKIRKSQFDLEDFLGQLKALKKMGPLESILGMIPGLGAQIGNMDIDPSRMGKVEAFIYSMTIRERRNPKIIDGSRRKRISLGSGTTVTEVNQLLKQFFAMSKMIKSMTKRNKRGLPKGLSQKLLSGMGA